MRARTLESCRAEQEDSFLGSQRNLLCFHAPRYRRLLIDLLGCRDVSLVVLDDDGHVAGFLPILAKYGPYGIVLNSLPFCGSNGGVIAVDGRAREVLVEAYNQMARAPEVAAATIIENPLNTQASSGIVHDLLDVRIGQLTPLPTSGDVPATLMQSFHSKTRNMLRKADRLGIDVRVDNGAMNFLSSVHELNMSEIGAKPKPRAFFEAVASHLRADVDYRIYVGDANGEPVAALLVLYFGGTADYFTPVIRKEFRETQALSAVIFRAMQEAAFDGHAWWNWGGTWLSQDGVYRFKSRWGTQDMRYRYFTAVSRPELLKATAEELLAGYPGFFVVPFSALAR